MSQPEWAVVYETDYSTLYKDLTGEHPPELAIREEWEDSDGSLMIETFRFPIPRLKLVADNNEPLRNYLVSEAHEKSWPHPTRDYEEWFAESLPAVASSVGCEVEELIEALVGEDIRRRAWAYESIGGHHGFMNFDEYPQTGKVEGGAEDEDEDEP